MWNQACVCVTECNKWLTCWLGSCSSQGRLQSCPCAWRCPWTSRPDSVPAPETSLPSSAPAHPPYGECRGTWPHSWMQNKQNKDEEFNKCAHANMELTSVIFSLMEIKHFVQHAMCSGFIPLYICHHLLWDPPAGAEPSDPEQISSGGQNNLRVIPLQQCKSGSQEDRVSAGMFSMLSGEGNINASESDMHAQADTDDGRIAGMGGSNSYQVYGVSEE